GWAEVCYGESLCVLAWHQLRYLDACQSAIPAHAGQSESAGMRNPDELRWQQDAVRQIEMCHKLCPDRLPSHARLQRTDHITPTLRDDPLTPQDPLALHAARSTTEHRRRGRRLDRIHRHLIVGPLDRHPRDATLIIIRVAGDLRLPSGRVARVSRVDIPFDQLRQRPLCCLCVLVAVST